MSTWLLLWNPKGFFGYASEPCTLYLYSLVICREMLALLGLEVVFVSHLEDPKETRDYVRADTISERATAC